MWLFAGLLYLVYLLVFMRLWITLLVEFLFCVVAAYVVFGCFVLCCDILALVLVSCCWIGSAARLVVLVV